MHIQEVFERYSDDLSKVEECMDRWLQSDILLIPQVIRHLIGSGGKRFRPLLLLAAADLSGCRNERRYNLSVVIEFLHTATLLHDDVIDNAELRRGKVSANNIWGNAASVLVGDFLYSTAFKLMTADGDLAVLKMLSQTTNTMSEGEVFQLVKCGNVNLTEEEYLSIIEKKTSVLISTACAVGGLLGNAADARVEALAEFGMLLGSAFQITDDTLDYMAREEEFGKAIGKDLEEGKITLPLIYALKQCSAPERDLVERVVQRREEGKDALPEIMAMIRVYGGVDYALAKASAFIDEGRKLLRLFPESEAKTALETISGYIIERRL